MFYHQSTVVYANTGQIVDQFPFELIDSYNKAIIETFSVSISFLRVFAGAGGYDEIDIIYGNSENILTRQVRIEAAVLPNQPDEKLTAILRNVEQNNEAIYAALGADRLRMFISPSPSHKKLFLLSRADGARRAILGSANASINGVCGMREEALVVWDGGPVCDELFRRSEAKLGAANHVKLAESIAWIRNARTETLL